MDTPFEPHVNETAEPMLPAALAQDWPEFGLVDDVRPALAEIVAAGQVSALATLYAADGGAPRGIGAQFLVSADRVSGYVSGGCIEADVALHALATIADGTPRWLVYGEGGPVDIRLPCGGRVEILVERLLPDAEAVRALARSAVQRRPVLWLSDGIEQRCLDAESALAELPEAIHGRNRAGLVQGSSRVFRRTAPQPRAVVVGSDPTTMAMAMLSAQSGMETFLVRPKGPETPPPLQGVYYLRGSVEAAFEAIGLDGWTAVATATHDEIDDHEALVAALPSAACYVGLLGSRRRLKARLDGLRYAGVSEAAIARLRAPIGFDLGGNAPLQIALGTVAEMVQAVNGVGFATTVAPAPLAAAAE